MAEHVMSSWTRGMTFKAGSVPPVGAVQCEQAAKGYAAATA